jgi:hypothetical protein
MHTTRVQLAHPYVGAFGSLACWCSWLIQSVTNLLAYQGGAMLYPSALNSHPLAPVCCVCYCSALCALTLPSLCSLGSHTLLLTAPPLCPRPRPCPSYPQCAHRVFSLCSRFACSGCSERLRSLCLHCAHPCALIVLALCSSRWSLTPLSPL